MLLYHTAQRISSQVVDNVNFQRHLFAYTQAANIIRGTVIETGCGDGYGIKLLIDHCDHYVAIDKNRKPLLTQYKNIDFFRIVLPRLKNIPSSIFDYAISFQVIEHIKEDTFFLRELRRILKPGGRLLLTTPNKLRSVSRNPWHIREYLPGEIEEKIASVFPGATISGIYGNEKVERYLALNKKQVDAVYRLDIFKLSDRLPGWMLRLPYDILNDLQKKRLKKSPAQGGDISHTDFYIGRLHNHCLDYFVEAVK